MSSSELDIEAIFDRARQISEPNTRATYLDDACAGDSTARRRIDALLAALEQAGDFLETSDRTDRFSPVAGAFFSPDEPAIGEQIGSKVGPYSIIQKIGEGGFGAVYLASQEAPVRRHVALKIIKFGMDTRRVVARFEAERQALAMMDHPHIARVFDAGATDYGRPYFVMELVNGMPITEYCDRHCLTTSERLHLFVDVCAAVQHAHHKGVIHRDLKPSNVLISSYDDTPTVKVIDFGVAKATADPLTDKTLVTGLGQMVGTPLYMSPEQASQSDLDIDTRSDIYTLGVLLYELLTGTLPFEPAGLESAGYAEIQRLLCDVDPPRPSTRLSRLTRENSTIAEKRKTDSRQLVGMLRGDLDAIVMKCLEKSRDRRYDSAAALAADIDRYLRDEIVEARAPGFAYRVSKFIRRHRVAAGATIVVATGLVLGSALAVWGMLQAQLDRDRAVAAKSAEAEQRRIASARAESLRRELYRSTILRISGVINSGAADPIKADLNRCDVDLRHWEWRRLRFLADTSVETIQTDAGHISKIAFAPDARSYLLAEGSGRISLRSTNDHSVIREFVRDDPSGPARDACFSLDGRRVATISPNTGVFVWDVESGALIRRFDLDFGNLLAVALDGDGGRVAVGSFWSDTLVLNVDSGETLYSLSAPAHRARSLQYFDGGHRLMVGSLESDVSVFDVDSGEILWHKPAGDFVVWSAAVSPDGQTIVATSGTARIVGLKASTGELLFDEACSRVENGDMTIDDRDGRVYLGASDGLITAYDLRSGEGSLVLRGHEAGVTSVALNPESRALYSTAEDGTIKRWTPTQHAGRSTLVTHHNILLAARISLDHSRIYYGGHRGGLQIYDLTTGRTIARDLAFEDVGDILEFPDGSIAVSGGKADSPLPCVAILSQSGAVLHQWCSKRSEKLNCIVANNEGTLVLSAPFDNGVRVWDVASGKCVCQLAPHDRSLYRAAFSGDGESLISIDDSGLIESWSIRTGEQLKSLGRCSVPADQMIASHDGRMLIFGFDSGLIEIRDAHTGRLIHDLRGHIGRVRDLALSPDDRRLISCGNDAFIRLWDTDSGRLLMNVGQHSAAVTSVAFDSDGSQVVSCGEDHTLRCWRTAD